ncbi:hypothetical protein KFE25_009346 [Diacronema lutheri]|uniref:Uncharacterized protein n=1 Tax=Diacronema lutheri TaxID=2081491 RepID=A0A8J5XZK6_DIALT|nr:hypothetical protein KFE25_009346 [Diacronema lutheri]
MDAWVGRAGEVGSYALSFGAYYFFVRLALAYRWELRADWLGTLARAMVGSEKRAEGESRPAAAQKCAGSPTPTAESFRSKGLTLLFCIVGIQASFLCWGVLQERIMTRPYGVEEERFKSSKFLVFVNRIVALIVADAMITFKRSATDGTPPFRYSYCATSNILSSVCQYEALKYVSFPTQVLAKSCKMVPVMLMGYAVTRRAYPPLDWFVALAVTGGVLAFKLNEATDAPRAGGTESAGVEAEVLGYVLIAGYMAFDSFTSNWQEALFREYPAITPVQMMRQVNLFSATFTAFGLLLTSEAFTMPAFLARHPDCALHIATISVCSATGQLFIFYTIKQFGALVFATINTVRTLFSVVLSFLVFSHAINAGEALGIASVFAALGVQVVVKWQRATMPKPVTSGNARRQARGAPVRRLTILACTPFLSRAALAVRLLAVLQPPSRQTHGFHPSGDFDLPRLELEQLLPRGAALQPCASRAVCWVDGVESAVAACACSRSILTHSLYAVTGSGSSLREAVLTAGAPLAPEQLTIQDMRVGAHLSRVQAASMRRAVSAVLDEVGLPGAPRADTNVADTLLVDAAGHFFVGACVARGLDGGAGARRNFAAYGLHQPDFRVANILRAARSAENGDGGVHSCSFDAIICDPPYGMKVGFSSERTPILEPAAPRAPAEPDEARVQVALVVTALLRLAQRALAPCGRLVFFMPVRGDDSRDPRGIHALLDECAPAKPAAGARLRLVDARRQTFSPTFARWIVILERLVRR